MEVKTLTEMPGGTLSVVSVEAPAETAVIPPTAMPAEALAETLAETRAKRLANARLSLMNAEKTFGLTHVSAETGRVWHVEGGNKTVLKALERLREPGQWVGFVAFKNPGWSAVAESGIPLEKVLYIPKVETAALKVLAALIDGVDLIAAGPLPLTLQNQRALAGRARARKTTILTTKPWLNVSKPWKDSQENWQERYRIYGRRVG
ncbi:MAG: hypothetical protein Q4E01_04735 [Actinomycetaceae bacterium]|nr:hypothetical protein [Actinomycetaceae bacterium]